LVYGQAGVGKTSLAKTLKEKTLIISAEAGTLSVADADIDMIDISIDDNGSLIPPSKRIERLKQVFIWICEPEQRKKYKWIFIDSLTEVSQNMIEKLQKEYPDKSDTLKLWGDYSNLSRALVKNFRDLSFYNVVFTALEAESKDNDGIRFLHPQMQGKIGREQLAGFFDEVFYFHIDKEGKRKLLTEATERVQAKDRSGKLDRFEGPDLQKIANKINGGK
jgi:phage nucleotide-binding protein